MLEYDRIDISEGIYVNKNVMFATIGILKILKIIFVMDVII